MPRHKNKLPRGNIHLSSQLLHADVIVLSCAEYSMFLVTITQSAVHLSRHLEIETVHPAFSRFWPRVLLRHHDRVVAADVLELARVLRARQVVLFELFAESGGFNVVGHEKLLELFHPSFGRHHPDCGVLVLSTGLGRVCIVLTIFAQSGCRVCTLKVLVRMIGLWVAGQSENDWWTKLTTVTVIFHLHDFLSNLIWWWGFKLQG